MPIYLLLACNKRGPPSHVWHARVSRLSPSGDDCLFAQSINTFSGGKKTNKTLCRLALIFTMVVRLRVTEIECCLAVAVPFDACREIGRDGMRERTADLISQCRFFIGCGNARGGIARKTQTKWILVLRVRYCNLLCLLKCRGSRWALAFIGKNRRRSSHKILHLVHICVSNTNKVDKLSSNRKCWHITV